MYLWFMYSHIIQVSDSLCRSIWILHITDCLWNFKDILSTTYVVMTVSYELNQYLFECHIIENYRTCAYVKLSVAC